jgi:DNA repair protein RecO (recombination protein O)
MSMSPDESDEAVVPATGGMEMPGNVTREPLRRSSVSKQGADTRIAEQPGFVLHSYVYRESSLVVDVFTRDYGRVALVAKGAKRPASRLRGVLQTFQPLSVGWSGKSELRTLTSAEWVGGMIPLDSSALLYGFYLNELLIRLLAREDPHQGLFEQYVRALTCLATSESAQTVLRIFELALLKETGVAADLSVNAKDRCPVEPEGIYVVDPENGPRFATLEDTAPRVSGKTLLDMVSEDYSDPKTQLQSKLLMRFLLTHHLNGVPLQTRKILIDLRQL